MDESKIILGAISGSSLDGLDLAICRFIEKKSGLSYELLDAETIPFNAELRDRLEWGTNLDVRGLKSLDVTFSKFCGVVISRYIRKNAISLDYLASHGHTVYHNPDEGYTLQLGQGAILAAETGIKTITDFRSSDMAYGGQGAPLAPIVEQYLFPGHGFYLNLGGIANVSIHLPTGIISFDSVPCNQCTNFLARKIGLAFDKNGELARKGTIDESLMAKWSALDYFKLSYPKSMDNDWVRREIIGMMDLDKISVNDALCTATHFTARQLAKDLYTFADHFHVDDRTMMISGGGAHNTYLVECLQKYLDKIHLDVIKPADLVIDFKEAILMSLMGYLRITKQANALPSVTGAKKQSIGGAIYLP